MRFWVNIFRNILFYVIKNRFRFWFRKNKRHKLVVFDLDNTIAYVDDHNDYRSISIYNRLRKMNYYTGMFRLLNAYSIRGYKIIILTARDYRFYLLTYQWLKSNNISFDHLTLVHSPHLKKSILKIANVKLTYYDDLSYNQEGSQIKYYDDLIYYFSSNKCINYFALNQFKRFQKM